MFNYQVLAISTRSETPVYMADGIESAAEMAMNRNKPPYNTLFIVERPDGYRLSIAEQKELLGLPKWG